MNAWMFILTCTICFVVPLRKNRLRLFVTAVSFVTDIMKNWMKFAAYPKTVMPFYVTWKNGRKKVRELS